LIVSGRPRSQRRLRRKMTRAWAKHGVIVNIYPLVI
jgi:hypothetical protein